MIPLPDDKYVVRFAVKVEHTDTCWIWTGPQWPNRYGGISSPKPGFSSLAHRFAYQYLVGSIPSGLDLDHTCRVRTCVNPAHLEPVTRRENVLRGIGHTAVNARKTHCPQGHPYDEANTYRCSKGYRYCRQCIAARRRKAA